MKCKYCGKESGNRQTCLECRKYIQNIRACEKLGFTEGSLKERFENSIQKLYDFYYNRNLGLIELSKETGLNQTTVRMLFRKANIPLRSISEGIQTAIKEGRTKARIAPNFHSGVHVSWSGQECRYRSSWELEYMKQLDEQKINYIYEPWWIWYYNSEVQKKRLCCPDFFLPDTNEIVELKSSYTIAGKVQEIKDKFKEYKNLGYYPKLLLNWKFVDPETL